MAVLAPLIRTRVKASLLMAGVLATPWSATAGDNGAIELAVDFSHEHQRIDHFGASDAWSINPTINRWEKNGDEASVERLADLLFSTSEGIGLSAWRFNVGAGSAGQGEESRIPDAFRRAELLIPGPEAGVDASKQAGQVRFLKEAHERGVADFVAFLNSPPVWATKNGLAHPGGPESRPDVGSTNLRPDAVDRFSAFMVDVLDYLRGGEVGVPVNYISPVNEPTWEWEGQSQEANRYNLDDLKAVYLSLHHALKESGLDQTVQIDGAEVVEYAAALSDEVKIRFDGSVYAGGMNNSGQGIYRNYINELLGDPAMTAILGSHLSMHGYFSDAWSSRMGELRDMTWDNLQEVSPGAGIWMSEFCILGGTGDVRTFGGHGFDVDDMDYALHVSKVIHRDLTRLNASAWHWWLALTPYDYKDGLLKINNRLESESLQTSKVMWTLGNYSRFIRPGYRRVALPGVDNLNGVMASAYKSGDGEDVVVVAINAADHSQKVNLLVNNLPDEKTVGPFVPYTTNAEMALRPSGAIETSYTIPARSTVTLVAPIIEGSDADTVADDSADGAEAGGAEQPSRERETGGAWGAWLMALLGVLLVVRRLQSTGVRQYGCLLIKSR